MTRYDMGKYIQFFLENYSKEPGIFGRKNEQAFELLDLIESHGMVPPIREELSWKTAENGEMTYAVHEWEPEDWEKK